MLRVLAVVAAIVAVVLFVVVAAFTPTDPFHIEAWGFVCLAASLGLFELEGLVSPRP